MLGFLANMDKEPLRGFKRSAFADLLDRIFCR